MSKIMVLLVAVILITLAPVKAWAGEQDAGSAPAYFSAALWRVEAMPEPISLYIMDRETFLAAAFVHGLGADIGAFAKWNKTGEKNCKIYVTADRFELIIHEIRHCQDGKYHE